MDKAGHKVHVAFKHKATVVFGSMVWLTFWLFIFGETAQGSY
jgi:hypothetical protein